MNFSGFLGNDEVKEALSLAFASLRFPHAILFQGEKGCGKRTLSLLTAQALVCRNKESAPCGECPSCIRAKAGSHPDIRVVEGSGATRSLTVDMIKDVAADAARMPEEASVSVYVLFLGDKPLEPAQNKLLKLIEEPPPSAVFLLVCPSADRLLPTVRSRVQIFTLQPPPMEEAARRLMEKKGASPEQARELAGLCNGNLGEMEEELGGGEAAQALGIAREMARAVASTAEHGLLAASAPLIKDRKLFLRTARRLGLIFRDALMLRMGGKAMLGASPTEAKALGALPKSRLMELPELCAEFQQKAERNGNMTLVVTDFCARLTQAKRKAGMGKVGLYG